MQFTEVIRKRRMVRAYADEPVDPESLERIVDAGRRVPSAGFSQGQAFVVVESPKLRRRIANLADEDHYVSAGFDPWISTAPVHIVICCSERIYRDRYDEADKYDGDPQHWPVPYWWVDAGAAMQNILLAAVNEGLGAGFLGVHSIPGLKELLGIPDDVDPIGIVTLGHPAPDRKSTSLQRGRRPNMVHRERWTD